MSVNTSDIHFFVFNLSLKNMRPDTKPAAIIPEYTNKYVVPIWSLLKTINVNTATHEPEASHKSIHHKSFFLMGRSFVLHTEMTIEIKRTTNILRIHA